MFTIGFRPQFLQTPIIYGKKFFISLANGEKHAAQFAIVELSAILASHNERTFAPTGEYPTINGQNINDRNYHQDTNAQGQVLDYAANLDPNRIVTNSKTDSGTPIITIDGIVISGNNRTMSLKIAAEDFPERYDEYKKAILEDLAAFGIEHNDGVDALMGRDVIIDVNETSKYIPEKIISQRYHVKFTHPVIVRIDYDFAAYTTTELSKYNKDRKKAERPVDKAIKLGKILSESDRCKDVVSNLVGEYETFTEFYSNYADQKKMRQVLLECNIINENELAGYFDERGFTEQGKDLIENMLAGLVLNQTALLAGNLPGIRSIRNSLITSLPVLVKNKSLGPDALTGYINDAFMLQSAIVASGNDFEYFINQGNLFDAKPSYPVLVMNRLLNSGRNKFKNAIETYNESVENNQHASLFDDKLSGNQIFDKIIFKRLSAQDQIAIEKIVDPAAMENQKLQEEKITDEYFGGRENESVFAIEQNVVGKGIDISHPGDTLGVERLADGEYVAKDVNGLKPGSTFSAEVLADGGDYSFVGDFKELDEILKQEKIINEMETDNIPHFREAWCNDHIEQLNQFVEVANSVNELNQLIDNEMIKMKI